jgi:hypothetical protein
MSKRAWGIVFIAIWLLLGPVAMAFDGCAGCELPCAQMACALSAPAPSLAPGIMASGVVQVQSAPVSSAPPALELPPKYLLSAA